VVLGIQIIMKKNRRILSRLLFVYILFSWLGIVGIIAKLSYSEIQTSKYQAYYLSEISKQLSFKLENKPSDAIRYPTHGPYDQRLGYTLLSDQIDRLQKAGFGVSAQASLSPMMLSLMDEYGLFPLYHEKNQAGLRLVDERENPLFTAVYPTYGYPGFDDIPPIILHTLLFIENRELLDEKYKSVNPAVEWERLGFAVLQMMAKKLGFNKVSLMKLHSAKTIKNFVLNGGFLFAMCSATDSYDIALAAEDIDICESMFDHDPADKNSNNKLDFSKGFAFENYKLSMNPMEYEYSSIDTYMTRRQYGPTQNTDLFTLFDFSAKWDPIPTMLTQNHESTIKGFMGQTTAFKQRLVKSDVIIMGETKSINEARYIHGVFGKGTFTFYGGHDPEDYEHRVGEEPTDLNLHPNSAGYRLILNNILFPAARKKKQKT